MRVAHGVELGCQVGVTAASPLKLCPELQRHKKMPEDIFGLFCLVQSSSKVVRPSTTLDKNDGVYGYFSSLTEQQTFARQEQRAYQS